MIRPRECAAMAPLTGADLEQYRRDCSRHAFLHLCWREEVAWGTSPELEQTRAALDIELAKLMRRKEALQAAGYSTILAWPDRPETLQ
jgi:hypothetical protein